jgi:hypothetical protein
MFDSNLVQNVFFYQIGGSTRVQAYCLLPTIQSPTTESHSELVLLCFILITSSVSN